MGGEMTSRGEGGSRNKEGLLHWS